VSVKVSLSFAFDALGYSSGRTKSFGSIVDDDCGSRDATCNEDVASGEGKRTVSKE
jgi:hypothetical protein